MENNAWKAKKMLDVLQEALFYLRSKETVSWRDRTRGALRKGSSSGRRRVSTAQRTAAQKRKFASDEGISQDKMIQWDTNEKTVV